MHSAVPLLHYTLHIRHGSLFSFLDSVRTSGFPFEFEESLRDTRTPGQLSATMVTGPFIPNSQTTVGQKDDSVGTLGRIYNIATSVRRFRRGRKKLSPARVRAYVPPARWTLAGGPDKYLFLSVSREARLFLDFSGYTRRR
jgi:hypothetical protein